MNDLLPSTHYNDQVPVAHAQELLDRRKARKNIYAYIDYMKSSGLPEFQNEPAAHHRLILDYMQRLADAVHEDDEEDLLCSAPPGSAKTTWLSLVGITWLMARDPSTTILAIVNSDALSERNSRSRRLIMKTPEWERISQSALAADAQSLGFTGTTKNGFVKSCAAQSVVTGFRCHWLIVDDIIGSYMEAQSQTRLNKIWDWYLTEAKTRLLPHGKQMVIGTRWAYQDLIGRLLERANDKLEGWYYIKLQMINEDPHCPLGRKIGARLWPQWYTQKMVTEARRSPASWRTLYQCEPMISENQWMPPDKFVTETHAPGNLVHIMAIDLATGLAAGDNTVIMTAGLDEDGIIHFVDCFMQQVTTDIAAEKLCEMTSKYQPRIVLIDNDLMAKTFTGMLTEKMRQSGTFVPLHFMKLGNRSKDERADSLRGYLNMDRCKFVSAPWTDAVFSEFSLFGSNSGRDDTVDAAALIARYIPKISLPKATKTEVVKPALQIGPGGVVSCNDTLDDLWDLHENRPQKRAFQKLRI